MTPLILGTAPSSGEKDLLLKLTSSGITLLKQNHYSRRYTGNKLSAVDRQGCLWLRATELRKHVLRAADMRRRKKELSAYAVESADCPGTWYWLSDRRPKKTPSIEMPGVKSNILYKNQVQISDNLSTTDKDLLTISKQLSTKKAREYRVNKREVRQRLLGFINTHVGSKELYFWTVTFPEGTTDDTGYKIFNIWLTSLRHYRMLRNYLWVAERQKNGTVHFHIAVPHKMPVLRANGIMRTTMKTFAKRGEIPFSVYACNRYNGVDIAKHRKTKRVTNFAIKKGARSLITYLTKYVTKNDTAFSHLAWHNSRGYSSIFTGVTFTIQEFINNGWPDLVNRAKKISTEFFTFVPWLSDPPKALLEHLYQLNSYTQSLLNQLS